MAPEFPTIAETLPGYEGTSWYGIGAPAGTPEPVIARWPRLEAAIKEALAKPEMQARFFELGLDIPPLGRAGSKEFIANGRKQRGARRFSSRVLKLGSSITPSDS